jgi:hypothetical protein
MKVVAYALYVSGIFAQENFDFSFPKCGGSY